MLAPLDIFKMQDGTYVWKAEADTFELAKSIAEELGPGNYMIFSQTATKQSSRSMLQASKRVVQHRDSTSAEFVSPGEPRLLSVLNQRVHTTDKAPPGAVLLHQDEA